MGNGEKARTDGRCGHLDMDSSVYSRISDKKGGPLAAFCVYIAQIATEVKRPPHNLVTEEYTSETKKREKAGG